MFERKKFKAAALQQLKGRWKTPVLCSLLTTIIYIAFVYGMQALGFQSEQTYLKVDLSPDPNIYASAGGLALILFLIAYSMGAAFSLAELSLFNIMYKEDRKIYFSDFINGLSQWWQAIRGFFRFFIFVFLWFLLFCIPGYIKMFSYSMMFPIMAEYPEMSPSKAMRISKELTRGYKGDIFVTFLSFIGWTFLAGSPIFIISIITQICGFGQESIIYKILGKTSLLLYCGTISFLSTYIYMTITNVYHYLKQTAIDSNRISLSDFE